MRSRERLEDFKRNRVLHNLDENPLFLSEILSKKLSVPKKEVLAGILASMEIENIYVDVTEDLKRFLLAYYLIFILKVDQLKVIPAIFPEVSDLTFFAEITHHLQAIKNAVDSEIAIIRDNYLLMIIGPSCYSLMAKRRTWSDQQWLLEEIKKQENIFEFHRKSIIEGKKQSSDLERVVFAYLKIQALCEEDVNTMTARLQEIGLTDEEIGLLLHIFARR